MRCGKINVFLLFVFLQQAFLLGQNQLLIYSDESEMFRMMSPVEIKTAKYHNLIYIKALPFEELKITLLISGTVVEKNVKILKDHNTYYALSKEGDTYKLRYRGALPVEIPMPTYLKNRNHKWEVVYQKDQFIELEELIPDRLATQEVTAEPSLQKNSSLQKTGEIKRVEAKKIDDVTTPKAILDLIRVSNVTTPKSISEADFRQKIDSLGKAKTDSEKLLLSKDIFHNTSLKISQIMEVCKIFTHDFSKADFSIYAYASCQDPENYQDLLKTVRFDLIKALLNREANFKIDTLKT